MQNAPPNRLCVALSAATLILCYWSSSRTCGAEARRPNFIIIFTDDK